MVSLITIKKRLKTLQIKKKILNEKKIFYQDLEKIFKKN